MFTHFTQQLNEFNKYKNEVFTSIEESDSIVILRHVRPDPDALGSQFALKAFLNEKFPEKTVRALGEGESTLEFMGQLDEGEINEHDLVIILDTANVERIDYNGAIPESCKVLKIDHHPNREPYGDVNIVEIGVSSTSELLFMLLHDFDMSSITKEVAEKTYLGIIGDTGRFLYNSYPSTYQVAAAVVDLGVDTSEVLTRLYKKNLNDFRFTGYLINNFSLTDKGVAYIYVSESVREEYGVTETDAALQVNLFRDLEDVKVWFMALESGDEIRVRLRSKNTVINDVAEYFGGGGHQLASGVRFRRREDLQKLIHKIEEKL
ncbi:DHH family phosphoesterase [Phocicoccus pinnipedialis]|uniref:Bifunctional oligoribonuclease and PAP phosphatase NrnA n=1 Tax=Phocicoccus pinnipedialis TaxID=110845 RepID=A0A6V7RCV2_9BACL|nr:bifunctional oligoribonuclease/PAP phosphatase NrnA [Jeotgalicoccus pinnipedialis]MBP1939502.1 phosphoesterase RecJ-like protein [Jeotgalicoccus pinnipedialis]CAD2075118.1 Bifunctional oligoribonuclease and PAP phosphatase NrnA [Jeotgalicoccus pinnipedialis]